MAKKLGETLVDGRIWCAHAFGALGRVDMEAPNWLGYPFAAEILALPKGQRFTDIDNTARTPRRSWIPSRTPLVLDKDLRVITANRSFYLMFRMNSQDVQGRPVYALGDGQWNIPELLIDCWRASAPRHALMEAYRSRAGIIPAWAAHDAAQMRAAFSTKKTTTPRFFWRSRGHNEQRRQGASSCKSSCN